MSKSSYLVRKGEWVRTSPLSEQFEVSVMCSVCNVGRCGVKYYSVKSKKTICKKCFDSIKFEVKD